MRTAGIYVRISEDREGAGLGVARQEADCRTLCDRRDWDVTGVYVDNDVSATTGRPRPDYQRLLADVRAGSVTAIVCWHVDRLTRSVRELEDIIDLAAEHGVELATVTGEIDLGTPSGRMMARILGAAARHEAEHKAARQRRKHAELADAGRWSGGGTRPYGYADDRVTIVPDEADRVREAAGRVLAGEAVVAVARDWNRRGVRTPTGKQWTVHSLKRMLMSARISGRREHRPRARSETKRPLVGEITAVAVWPPIITVAESDKLRLLLADPNRRVTPGPNGRYPLTRLLYCPCGHWMVGRPRSDRQRRYVCDGQPGRPGCGKTYTLAGPAEQLIRTWVADAWASEEFRAAVRALDERPGDDDIVERIAAEQSTLDQLADDHGRRRITRSEWFAARAPILERVEQLRRTLTRGPARMLDDIPADFDALYEGMADPAKLRAWASAALERVTVGPAVRGRNRFDASRFDPTWRV